MFKKISTGGLKPSRVVFAVFNSAWGNPLILKLVNLNFY